MAAAGGHLAVARLLLEAGGEVEEPPAPQYRACPSPAMTAALHGEVSLLQLLLSSGAKLDKVKLSAGAYQYWAKFCLLKVILGDNIDFSFCQFHQAE